ncbi:MAG: hypothetical protein RRZ85_03900 [Gordonibacter sp.]|uniref:hypothetical protein n=1 Tax=Gordonibacter sp. TaxID=1968902 RepID=UPI002FC5FC3E
MTEEAESTVKLGAAKADAVCAACENTPKHLPGGKQHTGTDGKPMSVWQIWLLRLCVVMLVWAVLELAFGVGFWVFGALFPGMQIFGLEVGSITASVVSTALVSAALNLVIGLLGIRGAKNPCKITLFFWITLADAVLTAWAMASNIASGIFDVTGIVSGLFIVALAVCTWQVRGQTGYFDEHP